MSRDTFIPLVRCRDCDSPLLQIVDIAGPIAGSVIVARHCPECERADTVVAEHEAVQTWLRREARLLTWMLAAADTLAAGLVPSDGGARR